MVYLPALLELNLQLSDEQFFQLCQQHRDLKFERTANGELTIMSPTGGITGDRNSELNFQLRTWYRRTQLGKVFDSSTGFKLPNGANRSPDASWVRLEHWNALTAEEQAKFVPLCPDMVVELRSPSDDLSKLQAKMQEYRENGAELGWLIDPERQIVEIYRPHREPEILSSPKTLSGETILPDFELDLTGIL